MSKPNPTSALKERLRVGCDLEGEGDFRLPHLLREAADTIARLEAEVGDAKASRDQYADLYGRRCGDLLKTQCELASAQALIGELVEGLEEVRVSFRITDEIRSMCDTLILKARTLSGGSGG